MKRLVLCCDGTWNRADQRRDGQPCPTNVVKLAYRVAKADGDGNAQIVYYDHGVGTGNSLDRLSGGAFGRGLEENILDAYRFLIANYEDGDEIFLFGFSRGAFTVRSIAGMIRNCGILKRTAVGRYFDAVELYRDGERRPDHPDSVAFRGRHSVCGEEPVKIKLIGVWDTVGALGIPARGLRWLTRRKYEFHDTELSGSVEFAFHALAIDERRAPFAPTLWRDAPKGHRVEQVWFAGVHSDVGGGYPPPRDPAMRSQSEIPLAWMLDRATTIGGLALLEDEELRLPVRPPAALHDSRTGLYKAAPGHDRPIGFAIDNEGRLTPKDDSTQHVDDSVRERWKADPSYRPPELRAYFRRTGDPLAET